MTVFGKKIYIFRTLLKYLGNIGKRVPKKGKCNPPYIHFVVYFIGYPKPWYLMPNQKSKPMVVPDNLSLLTNNRNTILQPRIYNTRRLSQQPQLKSQLVGGYPPHFLLYVDYFPESDGRPVEHDLLAPRTRLWK